MEFVLETIVATIALLEILTGRVRTLLGEISEFNERIRLIEEGSGGSLYYLEQRESELLLEDM
jgi:hypothetical protein